MQYYKITGPNGESIHGGDYTYDLPTQSADGTWTPGAWTPECDVKICQRGYHVTNDPTKWLMVGCRAWEVEARSPDAYTQLRDKRAYAIIRLTRECPEAIPDWWRDVEAFVTSLADVPWFDPQDDPDPSWRVYDTYKKAEDAVWGAATVGTDAWDAANDAARDAAYDAAWNAAKNAVWSAAHDAAYDAAYRCAMHVIPDGAIAQEHIQTITSRWDVWQRGYGLFGEVDGTLYVYRRL